MDIISISEAIRHLCSGGTFTSYAAAKAAGGHARLRVNGLALNLTTLDRIEQEYGLKIETTEAKARLIAHAILGR